MSCNCNTASKTCEPCAFCLPPGVTDLPVCEGFTNCLETLDVTCAIYSGQAFSCIDVTNGENLWNVIVAILNELFPPAYCCLLEGTIEIITTTTTTTTTIPPAYCFSVENTNYVLVEGSYINEEGNPTELPLDPLQTVYICAIEVIDAPGLVITEVGECGETCVAPTTTSTTTAPPCQPYYLHCCKNDSEEAPIVIKPCYPNVVFSTGSIYVDSNGYYWVVTGTTGTVTSAYTSWGNFTFVTSYPTAQLALTNCQIMAASLQKDDCPGFIPAPVYLPVELCYSNETCEVACDCNLGNTETYYSLCSPISDGCILYTNSLHTIVAPDGFYSDGTNCYEVDGGLGEVVGMGIACNTTTLPPTYTLKYVAEMYNCSAPLGCSISIGETIVTVANPFSLVGYKFYRSTDPTDNIVYRITYSTSAGPIVVIDPFSQSNTCVAACSYSPLPE